MTQDIHDIRVNHFFSAIGVLFSGMVRACLIISPIVETRCIRASSIWVWESLRLRAQRRTGHGKNVGRFLHPTRMG